MLAGAELSKELLTELANSPQPAARYSHIQLTDMAIYLRDWRPRTA